MARRSTAEIPVDLRARLEGARLDLLALFRALDRMDLSPTEIPQRLIRQLFELDADYVEALWALDQPPGSLDLHAMLRDTLAALNQLPEACARFRSNLPRRAQSILAQLEITVRRSLDPAEAYSMVPVAAPKTVKHPSHAPPPSMNCCCATPPVTLTRCGAISPRARASSALAIPRSRRRPGKPPCGPPGAC